MSKKQPTDDDRLVDELRKLGSRQGGLNGVAGGLGTAWVARRLPNDTAELSAALPADLTRLTTQVVAVLTELGRVVESQEQGGVVMIKGVVGSGFMNMNPSVVTVQIEAVGEGHCAVTIRGTAKEGLIKQHAGEKAARRVAERLGVG